MSGKLRIELFDGLRIIGGKSVHFPADDLARRNLLAYIAYFRICHRRDVLAARCWPHIGTAAAAQHMRAAIYWLQDVLQTPFDNEPAVLVDEDTICLNARAVETDIAEFHAALDAATLTEGQLRINVLQRALTLYRGPLLTGFYEPWVAIEAGRVEDLFVAATFAVADSYRRQGEPSLAAACLQRAIALHPTRRELQNELIRLHAAAGQGAAARSLFENSRRLRATM